MFQVRAMDTGVIAITKPKNPFTAQLTMGEALYKQKQLKMLEGSTNANQKSKLQ